MDKALPQNHNRRTKHRDKAKITLKTILSVLNKNDTLEEIVYSKQVEDENREISKFDIMKSPRQVSLPGHQKYEFRARDDCMKQSSSLHATDPDPI